MRRTFVKFAEICDIQRQSHTMRASNGSAVIARARESHEVMALNRHALNRVATCATIAVCCAAPQHSLIRYTTHYVNHSLRFVVILVEYTLNLIVFSVFTQHVHFIYRPQKGWGGGGVAHETCPCQRCMWVYIYNAFQFPIAEQQQKNSNGLRHQLDGSGEKNCERKANTNILYSRGHKYYIILRELSVLSFLRTRVHVHVCGYRMRMRTCFKCALDARSMNNLTQNYLHSGLVTVWFIIFPDWVRCYASIVPQNWKRFPVLWLLSSTYFIIYKEHSIIWNICRSLHYNQI